VRVIVEIEGVRYVIVADCAKRLKISQDAVRKFVYRGRLAGSRLVGRTWLIPEAELERFASIPRRPGNPSQKDPQCED